MFTLARWNNTVVNLAGPLGYRLWRRYIAESARLFKEQQSVAREWAAYR